MPMSMGTRQPRSHKEEGFLLLALTVVIFLMMLGLAIAAPAIAKSLERDREVESMHRGMQYQRAIQLFYRKTGHYPASMDQLDDTNNLRFLRQHYKDPLTNGEYRIIPVGTQKTTVKGFFGEPLAGLPGAGGLGSASGMQSNLGTGGNPGTNGSSLGGGLTSMFSGGASPIGNTSGGSDGSAGGLGSSGSTGSTGDTGSTLGGMSAADFKGGPGPFIGVGTNKTGNGIVAVNGESDFTKWEFLYDPRVDQMKAKSSLLGGGMTSGNAGDLGTATSSFGPTGSTGSQGGFGSPSGFGSPAGSSPGGSSGPQSNPAPSNDPP